MLTETDKSMLEQVIKQLHQKARQNNLHARKGFKDFLVEGLTSARARELKLAKKPETPIDPID